MDVPLYVGYSLLLILLQCDRIAHVSHLFELCAISWLKYVEIHCDLR